MEGGDLVRVRVAGGREDNCSCDEVLGLPAGTTVIQLIETTDKKRGTREQDHGEGELANNEGVTEALMTATSGRAARAALQRVVQVKPHGEERRRKAEGKSGGERSDQRPAEDTPVEGKRSGFTVVRRGANAEPIAGPARDDDGADATGESEQQRLGDQRAQ